MNRLIPNSLYDEIIKATPLPYVDVIAFNKDKVLMMKRAINPLMGHWCFPGGRINIGESPEDTAIRELEEETGIKIATSALVGGKVFNHIYPDRHDIVIVYKIETKQTEVKLNWEHLEYKWTFYEPIIILPKPIDIRIIEQIRWATDK